MTRFTKAAAAAVATAFVLAAGAGFAANPMVGGAAMYANKDIVQNAVNSADHTTLVAAVKAAGLVDTLQGAGPFTVLAPNNRAFAALPAGTVDTLLQPQNKGMLTSVLTYHVLPGTLTRADIRARADQMGGSYTAKTVNGETVSFRVDGPTIFVTDATGHVARVTIPDVMQANGVIHGIDTVLMP